MRAASGGSRREPARPLAARSGNAGRTQVAATGCGSASTPSTAPAAAVCGATRRGLRTPSSRGLKSQAADRGRRTTRRGPGFRRGLSRFRPLPVTENDQPLLIDRLEFSVAHELVTFLCPAFVLVYSTSHDSAACVAVIAVVFVVLTVCGDAPLTATVWSTSVVAPEQSPFAYSLNRTLPARLPAPAATPIVAESFGTNDCAVEIVGCSEMTWKHSVVLPSM